MKHVVQRIKGADLGAGGTTQGQGGGGVKRCACVAVTLCV